MRAESVNFFTEEANFKHGGGNCFFNCSSSAFNCSIFDFSQPFFFSNLAVHFLIFKAVYTYYYLWTSKFTKFSIEMVHVIYPKTKKELGRIFLLLITNVGFISKISKWNMMIGMYSLKLTIVKHFESQIMKRRYYNNPTISF